MEDVVRPESLEVPVEEAAFQQQMGDLIVEYLEEIGVEYVFGVPGGAIEPLYNALARSARRGGPRPIVARHEGGAAFMAEGYARETGKLGVVCSTTGPGATNLITGVASAFDENIPMLVITAQTALPLFGKQALQESSCTAVNTVAMFGHCTRYSTLVSHRGQLEGKLVSAIMAATRRFGGPAHISIPNDILCEPRRMRDKEVMPPEAQQRVVEQHQFVDLKRLDVLEASIAEASKIVLLVGEECVGSIPQIMEFVRLSGATLVAAPQSKGLVDARHPQYAGVYGFAGHDSAREAVQDESVDLILAVGTRLDELIVCGGPEDALLNHKLVHIDATTEHFARSPMAKLHLYGDLSSTFSLLNQRLSKGKRVSPASLVLTEADKGKSESEQDLAPHFMTQEEKTAYLSDHVPLKPQRVMWELMKRFPADTRFIVDAGNSWSWGTHYLHPKKADCYQIGMGYGAMAWGVGASVGVSLGSPDTPVVCLTGDGSYLMSGQELTVAVAEKLPVIFIVLNDQSLGMVKHGQRMGGGEQIAFELPPVDFCQVARAMGAQGYTIRTPQDFEAMDMKAICNRQGPTLLDVYIDGEETPPMRSRIKTLRKK